MKRKLIPLLLALMVMMAYSMPALNSDVQVYATARTADNAISWAQSKVGKGIDEDGQYGCQCVDLIRAYYKYLGVSTVKGNGKDYASNALPIGWSRVKGGVPHKGDILVYGPSSSNEYGHVAIYVSDYVTYHQNYCGHSYVQKVTNVKYNKFTNPYWGCIRPNWSNSKVGIYYNVNGGNRGIASHSVLFGTNFYTPSASSTAKVGYTLAGFNGYRYKDNTYFVYGVGWVNASKIGSYKKALYQPGSGHTMGIAWIKDGDFINYNKLRFDAVWTPNNHTVSFNSNGAKGAVPAKKTVKTGYRFTLPSKGKMTKKKVISLKFKGWTVVRNADKKYVAKNGKWYANTKENLKKHPAYVYKAGTVCTLSPGAWLSNSMKNTKTSFTFKAVWKAF